MLIEEGIWDFRVSVIALGHMQLSNRTKINANIERLILADLEAFLAKPQKVRPGRIQDFGVCLCGAR